MQQAATFSLPERKRCEVFRSSPTHGLAHMLDTRLLAVGRTSHVAHRLHCCARCRRARDSRRTNSKSRLAKRCGAPTFSQCFWILIAVGIPCWFIVKASGEKDTSASLVFGSNATSSSVHPLPAFSPQPSQYRAHLLAYYRELLAQGQVTRPTRRFASSELTHRVPTRRSGDKRRKERISAMDRAKPMTDDEEACIVGIMADEELFLDEWLAYHVMLGFGHFFICDNGRKQALGQFLIPHVDAGYVTVVNWPDNHTFITTEKSNQLICYDMALFLMQEGEPLPYAVSFLSSELRKG